LEYCDRYGNLFTVYRRDNFKQFEQYLTGLFHECKHNIERMDERTEGSDYQQLHHFISESPWPYKPVLQAVGRDLSNLFGQRAEPVGLIIDESGHRKSGSKSVGVSRQYLGSIGKTDNGQVGVFAALSQGDDAGMVDVRLYLPKEWTDDKKRCDKAGIPASEQLFKSKPKLALEMIEDAEGVISYSWVGGDAAYGDSSELRQGITALGKMFVLDVRGNQVVYLSHPMPYIPDGPAGQGGIKNTYKSAEQGVMVRDLLNTLPPTQWKTYTFRQGTKGGKIRQVVCLNVYIWNKRRAKTDTVEELRLIISREEDGSEIKYSVTNDIAKDGYQPFSECSLLYRQMQRYWVERAIQDCKDTLGMTDYQVRTWRAWHHHITLTIMALHYMLEQKIVNEEHIPLLSCPDIKFFLAMNLPRKATSEQQVWDLILKRHELRQKDLDRYKT
jgi:SRSO17 transposase